MLQELAGRAWYRFCHCVTFGGCVLGFSYRTEGSHHIPRRGPVLLIANHQSYLDPVLVGIGAGRAINFLARSTLFKNKVFGPLIRSLSAFPVDQEGVAKEGLKLVIDLLQQGKPVLIFPEGTRTQTGAMQELRPGLLLVIKRTLTPIIPVGVAGAYQLFPRQNHLPYLAPLFLPAPRGGLAVSFGKPLDGKRYAELPREQALKELFDRIAEVQQRAEVLRRKD